MSEILRLVFTILTIYRLARLLSTEDGPLFIFARLRDFTDRKRAAEQEQAGEVYNPYGLWPALDEGLRCPFCTGVWFAALCAILIWLPTRLGDLFLIWMGLAGAQSLLQEWSEK